MLPCKPTSFTSLYVSVILAERIDSCGIALAARPDLAWLSLAELNSVDVNGTELAALESISQSVAELDSDWLIHLSK